MPVPAWPSDAPAPPGSAAQWIDGREVPDRTRLDADVCVVGGGPAGRAVVERLATAGIRTVLVDAGPVDGRLVRGPAAEAVGLPYQASEVASRGWGGTARIWDEHLGRPRAQLRELEPTDLEPRPWIPHSGWPISHDELVPYYRATDRLLGLEPTADVWGTGICGHALPLPPERIGSVLYRYEPASWFTQAPASGLSGDVLVVHDAAVSGLEPGRSGAPHLVAIHGVGATNQLTVAARRVVVAGGGLENTRLLLGLRDAGHLDARTGDHVGRFFMEHPKGEAGLFVPDSPEVVDALAGYDHHREGDVVCRKQLTLAPELRAAEELGGYYAALWPTEPEWLPDDLRSLAERARERDRATPLYAISFQVEQVPDPDSRIVSGTDAAGRPSMAIDWRLGRRDHRTLVRSLQLVQEELQLAGLGRVFARPYADDRGGYETSSWGGEPAPLRTSHHPTGTTRMAAEPGDGVVDRNGEVFGLDGVYIAGSSVFPTGSHINPTYTIVALALRLADHLVEVAAGR